MNKVGHWEIGGNDKADKTDKPCVLSVDRTYFYVGIHVFPRNELMLGDKYQSDLYDYQYPRFHTEKLGWKY